MGGTDLNLKLLTLLASLVLVVCFPVLVSDGSDAADLSDAPDANNVVDLGTYSLLKGSSPMTFDLLDSYGDVSGNDQLSTYQGIYITGVDSGGLPGWISVEKSYTGTMYEDFVPTMELVVDPVYAVSSTDYWCYSPLMGGILWTINVEVQDSDPTITPDGTYVYEVIFDSRGGSHVGTFHISSHNGSYTFDLSQFVPEREGYAFAGWSPDPSGDSVYLKPITLNGVPGETVSITVYAVWEESYLVIPTIWDGLIELFTNPLVLLIGLVLFLAVCLFIRNRMGAR